METYEVRLPPKKVTNPEHSITWDVGVTLSRQEDITDLVSGLVGKFVVVKADDQPFLLGSVTVSKLVPQNSSSPAVVGSRPTKLRITYADYKDPTINDHSSSQKAWLFMSSLMGFVTAELSKYGGRLEYDGVGWWEAKKKYVIGRVQSSPQ